MLKLVPPIANGLSADSVAARKDSRADFDISAEESIDAAIALVRRKFLHQLSGHRAPRLCVVRSEKPRS